MFRPYGALDCPCAGLTLRVQAYSACSTSHFLAVRNLLRGSRKLALRGSLRVQAYSACSTSYGNTRLTHMHMCNSLYIPKYNHIQSPFSHNDIRSKVGRNRGETPQGKTILVFAQNAFPRGFYTHKSSQKSRWYQARRGIQAGADFMKSGNFQRIPPVTGIYQDEKN